jgi:RNA ligase (TIGR02306 family)
MNGSNVKAAAPPSPLTATIPTSPPTAALNISTANDNKKPGTEKGRGHSRQLATIRTIDTIKLIEGADAVELATVGGWTVVVKKGDFKAGDLAIYCEIDSFIPTAVAPFLTRPDQTPKVYNGVAGGQVRSVKLRGQLSQGLLLPLERKEDGYWMRNANKNGTMVLVRAGDDVTEALGIQKWEPPISEQLAGQGRSNFPNQIPKTDQERVQNLKAEVANWTAMGLRFELTEKLDGSSCTMFLDEQGEFHVCSRKVDLVRENGNKFWRAAISYGVEGKLRAQNRLGIAIQGELIGEGTQGNRYGIKGCDFYAFDIYDTIKGGYLPADARRKLIEALGLKHVPVLDINKDLGKGDVAEILLWAEDKSCLNANTEREGIVFKCTTDPGLSFKAISNKYLLKGGN